MSKNIFSDIEKTNSLILDSFSFDHSLVDFQGGLINKTSIKNYLGEQNFRSIEVLKQIEKWCKGDNILDIGPCYGTMSLYLKNYLNKNVIGFEASDNIPIYCKALEKNEVKLYGWNFYENIIVDENLLNYFDFVVFSEVLEHLFIDLEVALDRIYPYIKVGGRLLITTPNFYSKRNLIRLLKKRYIITKYPDPITKSGVVLDGRHHPREYVLSEFLESCTSNCWKILRAWTWGESRENSNFFYNSIIYLNPQNNFCIHFNYLKIGKIWGAVKHTILDISKLRLPISRIACLR